MPRRLLVFVLFVVGLVVPTMASAATTAYAGTRVGAIDLAVHVGVGLAVDQAAEKHRGIGFTCDEIASGSPHAAEGGFGARLASAEAGGGAMSATGPIRVTEKGLGMVEQHLGRFGPYAPNEAMVGRLRDAMTTGTRVTGADANFYLHELNEATLMGRGMPYEAAHGAAIGKYGVSPYSLYAPSVIQANPTLFNSAWFRFWGL